MRSQKSIQTCHLFPSLGTRMMFANHEGNYTSRMCSTSIGLLYPESELSFSSSVALVGTLGGHWGDAPWHSRLFRWLLEGTSQRYHGSGWGRQLTAPWVSGVGRMVSEWPIGLTWHNLNFFFFMWQWRGGCLLQRLHLHSLNGSRFFENSLDHVYITSASKALISTNRPNLIYDWDFIFWLKVETTTQKELRASFPNMTL